MALVNKGPTALESLGIYMNTLDLDIYLPLIIESNPHISRLNLSGCRCVTMESVKWLSKITHLDLGACTSADDSLSIAVASHVPGLQILNLSHTKVGSLGVSEILAKCKRLWWFSLSFTCKVRFSEVVSVSNSVSSLHVCQCPR